jgi:MATE family multidrug resistance protein
VTEASSTLPEATVYPSRSARDVLVASLPVALSYGSTIAYESIALICLARYSDEAFAAIFPGFVVYFNLLMLPVGVIKYLRIEAAGEIGRSHAERVGQLLWLGFTLAVISAAGFLLLAYFSTEIFALIGHAPQLQALESAYFKVMCYGVLFQLAVSAFEALYLAIGKRKTLLLVQLGGICVNLLLTPAFIFGWGFVPELGIEGAGYATVTASILILGTYCLHAHWSGELARYQLLSAPRFTRRQLTKVLRIGFPSGIERVFEELTWTILLLVIGRFGVFALALSNVAINILELAYFPMIALGEVLSVDIAILLARDARRQARSLVTSVLVFVLLYGIAWVLLLIQLDHVIRGFYFSGVDMPHAADVDAIFSNYFRILCLCIVFGAFYYVFNAVLTARDDTAFPMAVMLVLFVSVFCAPVYFLLIERGMGVLWGWGIFLCNIALLCLVNGARYYLKPERMSL